MKNVVRLSCIITMILLGGCSKKGTLDGITEKDVDVPKMSAQEKSVDGFSIAAGIAGHSSDRTQDNGQAPK